METKPSYYPQRGYVILLLNQRKEISIEAKGLFKYLHWDLALQEYTVS